MHDTPDHDGLFALASEQAGYFTTGQAAGYGFSRALLSHHAGEGGRFIRVRHGLYRYRQYPSSPREDVLAAWITVGPEQAVVSHESALELFGLSDVVPDAIHITVPRSKRYQREIAGIRIHTASNPPTPEETVVRDGIAATSPVRSILDAAESGVAPEQVLMAIEQAVQRGFTTKSRLLKAARPRGKRVTQLIERGVAEALAR